ncbi:hypothetical protein GEMRC1_004340 [Eukaryota sp. GEM-RC1]
MHSLLKQFADAFQTNVNARGKSTSATDFYDTELLLFDALTSLTTIPTLPDSHPILLELKSSGRLSDLLSLFSHPNKDIVQITAQFIHDSIISELEGDHKTSIPFDAKEIVDQMHVFQSFDVQNFDNLLLFETIFNLLVTITQMDNSVAESILKNTSFFSFVSEFITHKFFLKNSLYDPLSIQIFEFLSHCFDLSQNEIQSYISYFCTAFEIRAEIKLRLLQLECIENVVSILSQFAINEELNTYPDCKKRLITASTESVLNFTTAWSAAFRLLNFLITLDSSVLIFVENSGVDIIFELLPRRSASDCTILKYSDPFASSPPSSIPISFDLHFSNILAEVLLFAKGKFARLVSSRLLQDSFPYDIVDLYMYYARKLTTYSTSASEVDRVILTDVEEIFDNISIILSYLLSCCLFMDEEVIANQILRIMERNNLNSHHLLVCLQEIVANEKNSSKVNRLKGMMQVIEQMEKKI